jgi:signal transduction histidine kinase/CheY-like chemotaxis protein
VAAVFDFISRLFDNRLLAPHGFCILWRPELLWTHVVSDALIFSAYMTIPAALVVVIRKRRDIPFGWMIWCFALFITACGLTHLMGIWTLWNPDYGVEALVKAVTAVASIATAVALWLLIPVAVSIPTPADLKAVNEELRKRIAERDLAIAELQHEKAQRQQSEEALVQSRKMDALGQLTGGIAHDFNNLLQAVQGSLELIGRRASDPAKVRKLADGAMQAAERGAKLTAQLLAFARSKQLKMEVFVVAQFLQEVRELLAGAAGEMVDLRFELDSGEAAVMADRTQLELAVLNLIINARDAMDGGGRVVVRTRRLEIARTQPDLDAGDYVEIRVTDEGPGMTDEVRARAFEPFFSTKGIGRGTGLGLSQVYAVARQAGGTARIESAPGQGATVSLILPMSAELPPAAPPARKRAKVSDQVGEVLVVDDDADVRAFAAAALAALGHAVREAESGHDALEAVRGARPDVVLLDYAMPGMTGAEVAAILQDEHPSLPIVFMTGFADAAELEPVLGRATVLRKPFRMDELGAALSSALGSPEPA